MLRSFVEKATELVWGPPTVILLFLTGVYLTFKSGFFQFSHIFLWLDKTLFSLFRSKKEKKKSGGVSQFQAVSTALASTIGTGNIAGVATALTIGGPGAVFWMWLSAVFSMMTAFSENTLGVFFRLKDKEENFIGGPMYYIRDGLKNKKIIGNFSSALSKLYAFFLVGAAFGIGSMTQANTVSSSLNSSFNVSFYLTAIIITAITALIISGGIKRIGEITEKLVPFMALFYISASLLVFLYDIGNISYVFSSIFQGAFSFNSAAGGIVGFAVKECVSVGIRRGIFSNEAGLGASVTVSSLSDVTEPVRQGMWGIFQVFVDTIIVCTMTAFVIISTQVDAVNFETAINDCSKSSHYVYIGNNTDFFEGRVFLTGNIKNNTFKVNSEGTVIKTEKETFTNIMLLTKGENGEIKLSEVNGVSLVGLAFKERFGSFSAIIVCVAVCLFAFSTIIGWSCYGEKASQFLFGKKAIKIYKLLYIIFVFVGSITELTVVWGISDIFNGLMAIPNLISLLFLSGTVRKITQNYLRRKKGLKIEPMLSFDRDIQLELELSSLDGNKDL
ncbi:MAG: alanine:cation symporter family protein [Clostridia bacterium]|nr:alanine:cation symporter family protein [Clostridia bacterium]